MDKTRILLIDDEVNFCKAVKLNLEHGGAYDVVTAASGREGLRLAEETPFDLVITDFRMPGMDGKAVLSALKAKRPHTPVVLFSIYYDDRQTITPEIERQADGLISKPIDHEQLERAIRSALATKRNHVSA
jgi:CheY-like chemotaxis protein